MELGDNELHLIIITMAMVSIASNKDATYEHARVVIDHYRETSRVEMEGENFEWFLGWLWRMAKTFFADDGATEVPILLNELKERAIANG